MSELLFACGLACLVCGVASAVLIAISLHKRGFNTSVVFLNVMIFRYLGQYRNVTREETGRTGPLFYSYIIAMNLALVTAIVGLLLQTAP